MIFDSITADLDKAIRTAERALVQPTTTAWEADSIRAYRNRMVHLRRDIRTAAAYANADRDPRMNGQCDHMGHAPATQQRDIAGMPNVNLPHPVRWEFCDDHAAEFDRAAS